MHQINKNMKYSFPDNSNPLPEKSNLNKILAIITITILVLFGLFLTTAYYIKKYSFQTNKNINTNVRTIAAALPQEPDILYERGGIITDIQADFITVQTRVRTTSVTPATAYEMRNLTVYIDKNTVFTKKSIAEFNQTGIIPVAEPSSRNELRIGDLVNVKANINIKDLTTFTASGIELIY